MATVDERLDKIEESLYKIRLSLAKTDEEREEIERERRWQLDIAYEEAMGEDL